jgi:inhibitor of KinA
VLGGRIRNDAVFYFLFVTFSIMGPTAVYRISEKAVTLAWEEKIDVDIHRQVMQADALIRREPFNGWIENVPAFHTLTIYYDPLIICRNLGYPGSYTFIEDFISKVFHSPFIITEQSVRRLTVPVCYDTSLGYDLPEASALLHITADELVRLHSGQVYHVFMLGFLPGFPYMGILPENLILPRKAVPMLKVPAGTVAIAGRQTGIYPVNSPGGWYAIGRTPVTLFKEGETYFEPGDQVEFYSISLGEYKQWTSA